MTFEITVTNSDDGSRSEKHRTANGTCHLGTGAIYNNVVQLLYNCVVQYCFKYGQQTVDFLTVITSFVLDAYCTPASHK